ncbi:MAG: hypothetical protein JO360_11880 [Acidobacteria bacterium]|nr:hypothetical protein [Acidobacteriota bacterium]
MARGWESKSVADQIEEDERAKEEMEQRAELSPEMRARQERLDTLNLSRARTLDQLERATNPAYRQMLQRSLRALEAEIEELQ